MYVTTGTLKLYGFMGPDLSFIFIFQSQCNCAIQMTKQVYQFNLAYIKAKTMNLWINVFLLYHSMDMGY